MTLRTPLRKALIWTAIALALSATWAWSARGGATWTPTPTVRLSLVAGCLRLDWDPADWPTEARGLRIQRNIRQPWYIIWEPVLYRPPFGSTSPRYFIALWPPSLIASCTALLGWARVIRNFFRAREGFCAQCKYPRTGLTPTAPCPECGTLDPSWPRRGAGM